MRTSRFVSLTDYCFVEYMAEELGGLDVYNDVFIFGENAHNDSHQIFNQDNSYSTTKNIADLTAAALPNNKMVHIDSERLPNYLTVDPKLTSTILPSYNVLMDKVRWHFVAGFDFDKFKGLLLQVSHTENDGKVNLFSNILLAPETSASLITFNPKPIFLGNATYDRYIDVLVPSIKNINEEYNTAPDPTLTFASAITPNGNPLGTGFITNNPIDIGIAECEKRSILNTNVGQIYEQFEITEYYSAQVSQSNEFDNVGAYIDEAADGDYIEFYLTFNSGFPADLISILNNRNPANDWIIIHQISVFEQVATSFVNTSRLVFFQEDAFDEPNTYRPVLKNANIAVSMSIDYLVRLTNRTTGEQIIREASYVLISPKKYGKQLEKIQLRDKPQSQRIYNKLIKKDFEASKLFIEAGGIDNSAFFENEVNTLVRTEYVPIFFNNNNVSVSNTSALVKISDSADEIVFGPGKLRFILSPFDNILRFKIFTANTSSKNINPMALDLNVNAASYKLVFGTGRGKVGIRNDNSSITENLSTGQISFNVSKKDSEAILESKAREVYIVSVSQDGKETLMYSGEWRKPSEQADVDEAIAEARDIAEARLRTQDKLDEISKNINKQTKELAKNPTKNLGFTKKIGIPSVVNKFGYKKAKGITPTSNTTG